MGGVGLEIFPQASQFPSSIFSSATPSRQVQQPPLLPLRAATDLVHHEEVLEGLPIGKDQVPSVLHSFREDLLYLLSNDACVETAQWVKVVRAGLLLPQLFLWPMRSLAGTLFAGDDTRAVLPSPRPVRGLAELVGGPVAWAAHTGSAPEEQRLFRQGWFPDYVDGVICITPP